MTENSTSTPPVSPSPDSTGPAVCLTPAGEKLYRALADSDEMFSASNAQINAAADALSTLTPSAPIADPVRDDGWLPIETAPKDGTHVDVWADGRRFVDVLWGQHDPYSDCAFGPEHWVGTSYYPRERGASIQYREPTHWRPIPAPPTPASDVPGDAHPSPDSTGQGDAQTLELVRERLEAADTSLANARKVAPSARNWDVRHATNCVKEALVLATRLISVPVSQGDAQTQEGRR